MIVNVIGMAGEHPSIRVCLRQHGERRPGRFHQGDGQGLRPRMAYASWACIRPVDATDRIIPLMKAAAKEKLGDESRWKELIGTVARSGR